MRISSIILSAAAAATAIARPNMVAEREVPVYTAEELATREIDANACFLVAFSGQGCTGNVGVNFNANTCATFAAPRASYQISNACPTLSVFLYRARMCAGNTPAEINQGPGCYDINTGFSVASMQGFS